MDDLVAAIDFIDQNEPLTPERQLIGMTGLYKQLVSTLEEVLPLLGLVLFGDPQVAKKFYRERTVSLISAGTVKGFFPTTEPERRRR